jgi:hypothetical protein
VQRRVIGAWTLAAGSSADVEAAAAPLATTVQATGMVLARLRVVSNGLSARYRYTHETTSNTSLPVPARSRWKRHSAICARAAQPGSLAICGAIGAIGRGWSAISMRSDITAAS